MAAFAQAVPLGANVDTIVSIVDSAISAPPCAMLVAAIAYTLHSLSQPWFIIYISVFALRSVFILGSKAMAKPAKVDWAQQVVVLTGGAHGIGLRLLQKLGTTGARIAVIDILDVPMRQSDNMSFYKCDLADSKQLDTTVSEITATLGTPTMLINNAGTLCPRLVHEQTAAEVDQVIGVNLVAPAQLTRQLLPGMLGSPSAHIVFISSALAFIGVPQLATYTASKAAITLFYESLKLEIRHRLNASHIKTTIFFPSKVETGMFNGLQLPRWLSPELSTETVADRIFAALDTAQSGEVYMPAFANLVPLYLFFPQFVRDIANWFANSIETMRTYKGYTTKC
ncbi:hypothetical protein IWW50_000034 [Coemansia erecta]|nr:hypothetical protein GGF43_000158 [Coemansia sp. RSA 2618]KAJ2830813.1 hypothetical protein IWW50_000034 [Coemansia erecta]